MNFCKIHRLLAGLWLNDQERLPRPVKNHLAHCAACASELERERELARELSVARGVSSPGLPASTKARIIAATRSSAGHGTAPGRRAPFRWVTAGCAAGLVLLLGFLARDRGRQAPGLEWAAGRPGAGSFPLPAGDSLRPWEGLLERPLEGEMKLAMDDGRRMLEGVVQSVAPDTTAQVILDRTRSWWSSESTR